MHSEMFVGQMACARATLFLIKGFIVRVGLPDAN